MNVSVSVCEHEAALVGLAIYDPSTVDKSEMELDGHSWVDTEARDTWSIMCRLRRDGKHWRDATDLLNFSKELRVRVDTTAIMRLFNSAGMPSQREWHVAELLDMNERDRLCSLASDYVRHLKDPQNSVGDCNTLLLAKLFRNADQQTIKTATIGELARMAVSDPQIHTAGIMTGIVELDELNDGFRPGELIVLAARPSVGKSAMAVQWAEFSAQRNHPTLFISLEMKAVDIALRSLAKSSGISIADIRQDQRKRLSQTLVKLDGIPLHITDQRGLNIDRLSMLIRRQIAQCGLQVVYVDYMGLLAPTDRRKPRWEQITEISNALKSLALAESIPIVALCQLNRDAEGEVPKLSHLRESGAIEQDADVVILLHRERQSSEAELHVAKNRNGPIGRIALSFDATRFMFGIRQVAGEQWPG